MRDCLRPQIDEVLVVRDTFFSNAGPHSNWVLEGPRTRIATIGRLRRSRLISRCRVFEREVTGPVRQTWYVSKKSGLCACAQRLEFLGVLIN